jgi:hypothetical protein
MKKKNTVVATEIFDEVLAKPESVLKLEGLQAWVYQTEPSVLELADYV